MDDEKCECDGFLEDIWENLGFEENPKEEIVLTFCVECGDEK